MSENKTENIVSEINTNVFFKEFTFTQNDFQDLSNNKQLEFADSVIWLDDIFFIFQIKERSPTEKNDVGWFESKVLNKAVKQIKSRLKYLRIYKGIEIGNAKGHKLEIPDTPANFITKIIIYNPSNQFPEEKRFLKFYESSEIGLIHLFHLEDYEWVCKYLITPAEIKEYFEFRESFYIAQKDILNKFPEQYILGHFLQTIETDHMDSKYIDNLKYIPSNIIDFDISFLIENFNDKIKLIKEKTEYYPIIKEIAKLNRSELTEFKKRFSLIIEKCQTKEVIKPYRIYIPRTDCAFVFIPLIKAYSEHWRNALHNYTAAQKYDQKSGKCIGVIIYEEESNNEKYFEMFWELLESKWEFDSEIEKTLKTNYPFREAKMQKLNNRYL